MKVKELKSILKSLPNEMEIIIQKDAEGNGYSPLVEANHNAVYIPETTWYGDMYYTEWSADDACMEEEEWNKIKTKPRVLVLCPVN